MLRANFRFDMTVITNNLVQNDEIYVTEMGYSRPPAGYKCYNLISQNYVIHYISKGKGYFNHEYIDENFGFLISPNEPVSFEFDEHEPWEHYWIGLNGTHCREQLEKMGMKPVSHVFACNYFKPLLPEFRRVIYDDIDKIDYTLYTKSLFYKAMALHASIYNRCNSDLSSAAKYIRIARQFVENNYQNDIAVTHAAAAANISPKYLYRIFMKSLHISPKNYITTCRLGKSKILLSCSSLSIKEISEAVGFKQYNYYTNVFHKYYGMTPSEYRHKLKGENINSCNS